MKKWILAFVFFSLLYVDAMADGSLFELWDISFGETLEETLDEMNEQDVVFRETPLMTNDPYKVLITPKDFQKEIMDQTVDFIKLEFKFDDIRESWVYSSVKLYFAEKPFKGDSGEVLSRFESIYQKLLSEHGEPTAMYVSLVDNNLESYTVYFSSVVDMLESSDYDIWLQSYPIIGIRAHFRNVVLTGLIDNYTADCAYTRCELYYSGSSDDDMIQGFDVG